MLQTVPEPRGMARVSAEVESRITRLLDLERARWEQVEPDLAAPITALHQLVAAGGKRLRPAFCYWAFVGAGGDPDDDQVVDAGAALELLHTFALVHDDIMDGSARRRGLPAVHAQFIDAHAARSARGESRRFGEGVGILVGDFAFVYSDMCLSRADTTVRAVFDELRVELCVGQYLDVLGGSGAPVDRARAERISVFKSGKYTVERPLHLGAALAGRLDDFSAAFTDYGMPVGLAFQLRDDILGVFGDPGATGKPVGDDLREGKLTPLIVETVHRVEQSGTPTDAALVTRLLESNLTDDEVVALQSLVIDCGARQAVEDQISEAVDRAVTVIDAAPLEPEARQALAELAAYVAWREA